MTLQSILFLAALLGFAVPSSGALPASGPGGSTTARVATFGDTCGVLNNPPHTLTAFGLPRIGNAQFELRISLPNAIRPTVSISTARLTSPLRYGLCEFWLPPASVVAALPARITGQVPVPVPNDPALIGTVIYGQTVAINAFSALPSFTNAIELRIGT